MADDDDVIAVDIDRAMTAKAASAGGAVGVAFARRGTRRIPSTTTLAL